MSNNQTKKAQMPGGRRGAASFGQMKGQSGDLKRVIKKYAGYFPKLVPAVLVCILVNAIVAAVPSIFQQKVLTVIENFWKSGDWSGARPQLVRYLAILISLYAVAWILSITQSQLLAYMTQKFMSNLREEMFIDMQRLPVKYFDSHKHGEIMSRYTNDIDTLRQLVSMAVPAILRSGILLAAAISPGEPEPLHDPEPDETGVTP